MIIERALTNGPGAAADLAGKRAAKQARGRGVALLSGLLLLGADASWAARPAPVDTSPFLVTAEASETLEQIEDQLRVPSSTEFLLAQADSDGARARRRRRPSFRRPGGSREGDAGAEQAPVPVPPPVPTTPTPAPTDDSSDGSAGGAVVPVPAPVPVTPTPAPPIDEGIWTLTPRRAQPPPPPRRLPTPVRPGDGVDNEGDGESSGAPAPTPIVPRSRRRPGERPTRQNVPTYENDLPDYEFIAVPDRWRIIENLGVNEKWYDPYNQNTLKGDRPIPGTKDWFINVNIVFDHVLEARRIPIPTGVAGDRGSEVDLLGDGVAWETQTTLLPSISLVQGDTTFRPPDWEIRITPALNVNKVWVNQLGAVKLDPREGDDRLDYHFTLQEAFIDKHLWNRTDRFDFDSLRVGIQPFNADFRGFLFESSEPGVRLFGNFFNNRGQYNLAWFGRLNKDTNSGLNNLESWRDDHTIIANFYYQDFPVLGFNVEAIFAANINREGDEKDFDNNKNLVIPSPVGLIGGHDYEVYYVGLGGDGHIERLNLTFQLYGAFGHDDYNPIAQRSQDIESFFAAFEASYDLDWMRYKAFFLYSMGDDDPYDDKAQGFDTILDNPNFAGGTTSFWMRQQIPFVFGGGVALSGKNSIVPSLRSSKGEGQSNFVNPGLWQAGVGADFDVLPELRILTNISWLQWDSVQVLETLRQQDRLSREIGWDISAGVIYRPFFTNNVVLRASGSVLIPGSGYEELFDERSDEPPYSALVNVTFTF